MALTITDANAKEIIASGKPVIIDFWATWCGPCMAMGPIVDDLAAEYEGRVVIGKYNVDEEGDLAAEHRIMSIPTFLFFKNRNPACRITVTRDFQSQDRRAPGSLKTGKRDREGTRFQPHRVPSFLQNTHNHLPKS